MMQPVIAAVVGAGAAGLLHALSFRAHRVAVAYVYDPDPERAKNLAELCGATCLPSVDAIADSDADYVTVCSPPRWHVEQAERCARGEDAGHVARLGERRGSERRVVFVEKPVALSPEELTRLARLPRCVPIVQWRSGRGIRAVKHAIAEGLLGPSPTVSVDLALHRDAAYFAAGRASTASWGCGALLSVGIHALDAICFALDRPIADVHGLRGPHDACSVERSAAVVVGFAGGALASVRVTFDGAGPDETRLSFCGAGVTATLVGTEVDPTAGPVAWRSSDAATRERLVDRERACDGDTAAPLVVPYIGHAIAALRAGLSPGESTALPSIRDVVNAHTIAFRAYAAQSA